MIARRWRAERENREREIGSEDGEVAVGEVGGAGDDHVIVHHHQHIIVIVADVDGILDAVDVVDYELDEVYAYYSINIP